MHRNLDRRIEALVRLVDPEQLQEINDMFDAAMSDRTASWWLDESGEWTRHHVSATGARLHDLHNVLMRRISARRRGGNR